MKKPEPVTLLDYLKRTTEFFCGRGIENPRLNAELLLCGVLECRRIDLYLQFDRPLSAGEVTRYRDMIRRRGGSEPLQYILGTTEFCGREFLVTPDALIPRPETEILVEKVLAGMEEMRAPVVADIGTGSGCIALTIATERADARLIATDISERAVGLARRNAERFHLGGRVEFRVGDVFEPLAGERVDVVVANLPYISYAERAWLPAEVRQWEPEVALFAADEGLSVIARLVADAPKVVLPGGFVALEAAMGQAERITSLWRTSAAGWAVAVEKDLAGVERIVMATRPPA